MADHVPHQRSAALASLHLQRTLQNQFDQRHDWRHDSSSVDSQQNDQVLVSLRNVFSDIERRYLANKDYFAKPVRSFVKQADSLTDSSLVSALECFGKYSGVSLNDNVHV